MKHRTIRIGWKVLADRQRADGGPVTMSVAFSAVDVPHAASDGARLTSTGRPIRPALV
jgi:hypothetical protein